MSQHVVPFSRSISSAIGLFFFTLLVLANVSTARADWQNFPLPKGTVTSFASDAQYLYVSTDSGGVYRSSDNGGTWVAINNGLPDTSIAAVQSNGTTLFAALTNGFSGAIFVSKVHGTTWVAPTSPYFGYVFCFAPYKTSMLAGTWYGVARSTDNGNSWPTMNDNGLPSNATVTSLVVNGSSIVAGVTSSSVGGTGLFVTTNNGLTWVSRNTGLPTSPITALGVAGSMLLAGTGTGLYTSTNNGAGWTAANWNLGDVSVSSIAASGGTAIALASGGVFEYSPQTQKWTNIRENIPSSVTLTSVAIIGDQILVGANGSIWKRPFDAAAVASDRRDVTFELWPNPASTVLHLGTNDNSSPLTGITITDLSGATKNVSFEPSSSSTLDLRGLPAGTYVLHAHTTSGDIVRKFVVE